MWGKSKTPRTDKVLEVLWSLKDGVNDDALDIACIIIQYHREETESCIIKRQEAVNALEALGLG